MKNILKTYILSFLLFSFAFTSTKEIYIYSGDAVISLSSQKMSKRVDIIKNIYITNDDEPIKKRSHKRRRKVRRPRQGR